jgi:hypothetical protein
LDEKEQETAKKPTSNRSAKERRNTLFRVLDGVLSLSHRKIHSEGNSDNSKQALNTSPSLKAQESSEKESSNIKKTRNDRYRDPRPVYL